MTNSMSIKQLKETTCSQSELYQLKRQYEDLINSRRTFDRINTLEELVTVLIKRDELTEQIREGISKKLQKKLSPQKPQTPVVTARVVLQPSAPQPAQPTTYSVYQPEFSKEDQFRKVYSLIRDEIGSSWKEFARGLDIRESTIDDLQENERSISERVWKVLYLHQNTCDPTQWRKILLAALQTARRNDLKSKVESMLDRFQIIQPKP